jgi:pantetheine-phosphate adenylyltransferase
MKNGDGTMIEVRPFTNLLMHFAEEVEASVILRGLRAVSDFEYEFQMAAMNARLNSRVETVFLMASENHQFIASRFVKDVALFGGDIGTFVPKLVKQRTLRRLQELKGTSSP